MNALHICHHKGMPAMSFIELRTFIARHQISLLVWWWRRLEMQTGAGPIQLLLLSRYDRADRPGGPFMTFTQPWPVPDPPPPPPPLTRGAPPWSYTIAFSRWTLHSRRRNQHRICHLAHVSSHPEGGQNPVHGPIPPVSLPSFYSWQASVPSPCLPHPTTPPPSVPHPPSLSSW